MLGDEVLQRLQHAGVEDLAVGDRAKNRTVAVGDIDTEGFTSRIEVP